ncbi:hypothetical protein E1193_02505 [Micromonospora sp. KC606]|uniref:hypothetical protein n=1 Tax=Micromonospora sp. KC606 TaxID=2530379 RepID=UPI00105256C6|nr:hypothetical protein [Micromonospora sp. KC606]TDC85527.1 hypothetical protein E1193_02505 [Micromonospora sp. KC606]
MVRSAFRRGLPAAVAAVAVVLSLGVAAPGAQASPAPLSSTTQLCDCLFHGPEDLHGWAFHHEDMAFAAAVALADLTVRSVPCLAAMLLDRLAVGGEDASRFFYAVRLLLSLVFPQGPLPDGTTPADLTAQQYAAHAVLHSGLIDHAPVARLLRECNLPGDEETLRTWCPPPA